MCIVEKILGCTGLIGYFHSAYRITARAAGKSEGLLLPHDVIKLQHLVRGRLLGFVQCRAHSVPHLRSGLIACIIELASQVGVSDPKAQSLYDVPSVLFRQLTRRVDAPESRKDASDALCHSLHRCQRPAQSARVLDADGKAFRDVLAYLFEDLGGAVAVIPLLGGIYGVVHHTLYSTRCAGFVFLDALRRSVCDIFTDLLTLFFGVVFCTGERKDICYIDALGFEIGVELERHISLLEVSIVAERRKDVPDAVPDVLSQLFQCALDAIAFAAFAAPCPADEVDGRLDEHLAQGGKGLADGFGALVDGVTNKRHHSHQSILDVRRGVDDGRTQRAGKQRQCAEECACTGEVEHSLAKLGKSACQSREPERKLRDAGQQHTACKHRHHGIGKYPQRLAHCLRLCHANELDGRCQHQQRSAHGQHSGGDVQEVDRTGKVAHSASYDT